MACVSKIGSLYEMVTKIKNCVTGITKRLKP